MRKNINTHSIGDMVSATVIEQINSSDWIVSYDGQLLRIKNQSKKKFLVGQNILLQITAKSPLKFRVPPSLVV